MNPVHNALSILKLAVKSMVARNEISKAWKGRPANDKQGGRTDLMHAVERGYFDVVKRLIERDSSTALACDLEGKTALMLAARSGQIEMLKLLLPHSDVNAATCDGTTALMWASACGMTACVKTLLGRCDAKLPCKHGYTPLMLACAGDNGRCVDALLPRSDLNAINCRGERAEDFAKKGGCEAVLAALRRHAARLERDALEVVCMPAMPCLKRRPVRI